LACWRRSLPLPVSLKRFLAPLWVFIFGMGTDLLTYPQTRSAVLSCSRPCGRRAGCLLPEENLRQL
jgi:hypothetical protein